jgi:hypothetical protein
LGYGASLQPITSFVKIRVPSLSSLFALSLASTCDDDVQLHVVGMFTQQQQQPNRPMAMAVVLLLLLLE